MNEKKMWSFVGIFIIALVLTMPFYSASTLAAAVQITKNQGEQGIENYIDGEGDVWTVEALIINSGGNSGGNGSVAPENVRMKIGQNDASFTSCSESTLGTACSYVSPLTDGVKENEYAFQVIYNFLNQVGDQDSVSDADYIRVDGSAPVILFFPGNVKQNDEGQVEIDFTVDDKKEGAPAVGLKQIDILDGNTGAVLQSLLELNGVEKFNYQDDAGFNGILQAQLAGEGIMKLKIRAEDMLGHKITSRAVSFDADFVKPQIIGDLNLTRFGEFIGEFTGKTDIKIDILERSVPTVLGYSSQASLDGDEALCTSDEEEDDLWHCLWKDVGVNPESTVSILIVARDEAGNSLEQTVSKSLVVDESPPEIKFFGTLRQFEDKSYLKKGETKIILRTEDEGAGISEDGIRANLGAFDLSSAVPPKECVEEGGIVECYWEVDDDNLGEGVLTFGLSTFEDNVGNEGDLPEYEFIVDNTGPKVEEIEVYGYSEAGDKAYFQSNDILKIKMKVSEASGLNVLVNVNDLVMDAETKYPEDEFNYEEGWQRFTEEDCERKEGYWECVFETDPIKSGPDLSANLEIKVQDTAGNDETVWNDDPENVVSGKDGNYKISIAGLLTEDNPDYWEVRKGGVITLGGGFIDLDTTPLTYTRLPFSIALKSDNPNVEALNIELVDCVSESEAAESESAEGETVAAAAAGLPSPAVSRSILYGGLTPKGDSTPSPNVIIEFEPFDGRSLFGLGGLFEAPVGVFEGVDVDFVCQLKIFSKVGKDAVKAPEIQEVTITVPFGFSGLGVLDENLAAMITQAREDAEITILEVIGVLATILKWVDYLIQVYNIITDVIGLFQVASEGFDIVRKTQLEPMGLAACFGFNTASTFTDNSIKIVDVIIQVLSCSPRAGEGGEFATGWYGQWQSWIMTSYNMLTNELLGTQGHTYMPAKNIQENLFLSIAGLCLPGIIKNVDEYRQILCRKVMCLENEVAAGLATIQMCDALEDLMTCKYVVGELWYLMPVFDWIDMIIGALYNFLKDPFTMAHTLTFVTCGILCTADNKMPSTCVYIDYIWKIIDVLNNIIGFVKTMIAEFDSGGLKYCDAVL